LLKAKKFMINEQILLKEIFKEIRNEKLNTKRLACGKLVEKLKN